VLSTSLPTRPAGTRRNLTVDIARTDAGARRAFQVEIVEPAVILDVLLAAQRLEPSLAFRYSCRVAMCGTCAVRVDGRPTLACQTRVPGTDGPLRLEPIAGLPIVKDLVVDMAPFWAAWRRTEPWFVARADKQVVLAEGDPSRVAIERGLDCIACAACWAGCDLTGTETGFLGPAALNRAMVLTADRRDGRRDERLAVVSQSGSLERCHYIHGCSAACPKDLDPARAIRQLRRWRLRGRV